MNPPSNESLAKRLPGKNWSIKASKIIELLHKMEPDQFQKAQKILDEFELEGMNPEEIADVRGVIREIFVQNITKKLKKLEMGELQKTLDSLKKFGVEGFSRGEIEDMRKLIEKIIIDKNGGVIDLEEKRKPEKDKKKIIRKTEVIELFPKKPEFDVMAKPKNESKKNLRNSHLKLIK
jgi:hypothetical protein